MERNKLLFIFWLIVCLMSCKKEDNVRGYIPPQPQISSDVEEVKQVEERKELEVAEQDIIIENNNLLVEVKFNGEKKFLFLDTGCSYTSLNDDYIDKLKVHRGGSAGLTFVDSGGSEFDARNVYGAEAYLPIMPNVKLNFITNDFTAILENLGNYHNVIGVLGGDTLIENGLIIDYRERKLKKVLSQ